MNNRISIVILALTLTACVAKPPNATSLPIPTQAFTTAPIQTLTPAPSPTSAPAMVLPNQNNTSNISAEISRQLSFDEAQAVRDSLRYSETYVYTKEGLKRFSSDSPQLGLMLLGISEISVSGQNAPFERLGWMVDEKGQQFLAVQPLDDKGKFSDWIVLQYAENKAGPDGHTFTGYGFQLDEYGKLADKNKKGAKFWFVVCQEFDQQGKFVASRALDVRDKTYHELPDSMGGGKLANMLALPNISIEEGQQLVVKDNLQDWRFAITASGNLGIVDQHGNRYYWWDGSQWVKPLTDADFAGNLMTITKEKNNPDRNTKCTVDDVASGKLAASERASGIITIPDTAVNDGWVPSLDNTGVDTVNLKHAPGIAGNPPEQLVSICRFDASSMNIQGPQLYLLGIAVRNPDGTKRILHIVTIKEGIAKILLAFPSTQGMGIRASQSSDYMKKLIEWSYSWQVDLYNAQGTEYLEKLAGELVKNGGVVTEEMEKSLWLPAIAPW